MAKKQRLIAMLVLAGLASIGVASTLIDSDADNGRDYAFIESGFEVPKPPAGLGLVRKYETELTGEDIPAGHYVYEGLSESGSENYELFRFYEDSLSDLGWKPIDDNQPPDDVDPGFTATWYREHEGEGSGLVVRTSDSEGEYDVVFMYTMEPLGTFYIDDCTVKDCTEY